MATITEDYVSFEIAKLLKEKGFNYSCRVIYSPKGVVKHYLEEEVYAHHLKGHKKLCPTLQMAMKWLREVHKLDIDVSIEYKNSKKVYYYSILKKTVIRDIDCLHSETNFDSYEEACEAAIKYCLKNLI